MNDSHTRSEYLKALLNQKANIQQNGNALVNPSIANGDDLDTLAMMDTSLQGVSDTPTPEEPKDHSTGNWLQDSWNDVVSFTESFAHGFLGAIEGIADFGGTAISAVGSWFGADTSTLDDFIAHDYSGDLTGAMANLATGNGWDTNWESTVDSDVGQFFENISYSIGNMLPSIAIGVATGGATIPATAAFALGAAGGAAQEALQEDKNSTQALLYGTLVGAVETATEYIGGRVIPGEVVAIRSIGDAVKTFGSEAFEEALSGIINPFVKALSFQDASELEQLGTAEFWITGKDSVLMQALAGGVSGLTMGGARTVSNKIKFGAYSNSALDLCELGEASAERNQLAEKYGLESVNLTKVTDTELNSILEDKKFSDKDKNRYIKLTEQMGNSMAKFEEDMLKASSKSDDKGAQRFAKLLRDPQSFIENYKNESDKEVLTEISKGITNEFSDQNRALAFQNLDKFNQKYGTNLTLGFDENLKETAKVEGNRITLNPKYAGQWTQKMSHEEAHVLENFTPEINNELADIVSKTDTDGTLKEQIKEAYPQYKEGSDEFNQEYANAYLETLLTEKNGKNQKLKEKLFSSNFVDKIIQSFSKVEGKESNPEFIKKIKELKKDYENRDTSTVKQQEAMASKEKESNKAETKSEKDLSMTSANVQKVFKAFSDKTFHTAKETVTEFAKSLGEGFEVGKDKRSIYKDGKKLTSLVLKNEVVKGKPNWSIKQYRMAKEFTYNKPSNTSNFKNKKTYITTDGKKYQAVQNKETKTWTIYAVGEKGNKKAIKVDVSWKNKQHFFESFVGIKEYDGKSKPATTNVETKPTPVKAVEEVKPAVEPTPTGSFKSGETYVTSTGKELKPFFDKKTKKWEIMEIAKDGTTTFVKKNLSWKQKENYFNEFAKVETLKEYLEKNKKAETKEKAKTVSKETKTVAKETKVLVKTVDDIKNYAKANYNTYMNVSSSHEIMSKLVQNLNETLGKGAKVKSTNLSQKLFEDYNKLGQKEFVKNIDKVSDAFLSSEVEFEGATTPNATLLEILKLNKQDVNEFKAGFEKDLIALIKSNTNKSKLGKTVDFAVNRISQLAEAVNYYREYGVTIVKSAKTVASLEKKIKNNNITDLVTSSGLSEVALNNISNTLKGGIKFSKTYKGISPKTITRVISKLDWYSKTKLEKTIPFYSGSIDVTEGYISEFKDKFVSGKFPNRQLTLEETVKFTDIISEINNLASGIIKSAKAENNKTLHKSFSEWEVVRDSYSEGKDGIKNAFVNAFKKIFRITSSPTSTFETIFGSNSQISKILVGDIRNANSKHLNKMTVFENRLIELAQTLDAFKIDNVNTFSDYQKVRDNITKALSKKIDITIHHTNTTTTTTARIPLGVALDIYCESKTEGIRTLLNGGYLYKDKNYSYNLHHMSFDDIDNIEKAITEAGLKDFADKVVADLYNGDLKKYKQRADLENTGVENIITERYYPQAKELKDTKSMSDMAFNNYNTDPSNIGINKERTNDTYNPIKGMDFMDRFDNYISSVTIYGEMYSACKNFDVLKNRMLRYGNADNYISGFTDLINYYRDQIAGNKVNKSGIGEGTLYGNIVSATLGGNISVILKQTASLPTIMNEVRLSSFVKGLQGVTNIAKFGDIQTKLAQESGLLSARWGKGEVVNAQVLTNSLSNFAKMFGVGMEKMDTAVILSVGYRSAQFEAEARGLGAIGTQENEKEAIKILENIVAKTQSNSIKTEMSMARAGAAGSIAKVLSVFSSDLQNKVSYIQQLFTEKTYAGKRIEGAKATIDRLTEKLNNAEAELEEIDIFKTPAKYAEAFSEVEDIKKSIEDCRKTIDEAAEIFNDKSRSKRQAKLLFSMALSGLMIAGIEQLTKRLLGRKGWDEDDSEDFIKTFLLEATVYNLPFISQFMNAIEYDEDFGALDFQIVNEALSIVKQISSVISDGGDWNSLILPLLRTLGDLTGVPLYNLYNLTMGAVKNFDYETGTKWDMFVRGYSSSYLTGAYKAAIQSGTSRSQDLLSLKMSAYSVGVTSNEIVKEINDLYKSGYDAIPKNYATSYTNENGETVNFATEEQEVFRSTYYEANEAVSKAMALTEYKSATQSEQAAIIKKIYNAYYNVAKAAALNDTSSLSKLEKIIAAAGSQIDVGQLVLILYKMSSIEATSKKTKKQLSIEYLNRLQGISKNTKLLVTYLSGYSTTDSNTSQLNSYLSKFGIDLSDI